MKIRKKIIIILISIIFIVLSPFLFRSQLPHTDNVNITAIPKVQIDHYFIPVTTYRNYKNDYSLKELQEKDIVAVKGNENYLDKIILEKTITYINEDEIGIKLSEGSLALLTIDEVKPNFKSVGIEGEYFWDKEVDLDDYVLKYSEEVELLGEYIREDNERSQFLFTGEIIPARAVDRLALNKNNNYTYMYDFFKDELQKADISIGLLENPIKADPSPCTGCMSFVGDEKNAKGLAEAGFDILSLAGNHAGDGGQSGYSETIKNFDAVGIKHAGTGNSDNAKLEPAIYELNGERIGVIAADTVAGYYWNKGSSSYGTNWFSREPNMGIDTARVQLLPSIKENYNIDHLIVFMSWGIEYTSKATQFQKDLAHALIDNGVDLVMGSHPHWVQNIEFYKGVPIIYSLGNFLFDQNHTDPTRQGMNAMIYYYNGQIKSIEFIPHLACGPFVTDTNITDQYLSGDITMDDLLERDEDNGCVYFQALQLEEDHSVYTTILDRVMKYSDLNY